MLLPFPAGGIPLSFSLSLHPSICLSSVPPIPRMSQKSRKFTLESASSNSFPRTSLLLLLLSASVERAGPKWIGGWKFTRHGFRSSFAPSVLRKSKVARAYGADRDISIRYLDPLLRPSGRQLFFPGSIHRLDNASTFPLSSLLGVFSRNFSCERPRPDEQISFAKNVEPS